MVGKAALPAGLRIYAIGDVHGCLAPLERLHAKIADDLARHPVADHRIVLCGDYVDRGPDSAGVVSYLIAAQHTDPHIQCLYGNHEDEVLGFLEDPHRWAPVWLQYGGAETLASYGIGQAELEAVIGDVDALRDRFADALPADHLSFLRDLPRSLRFGDYLFVHAGIRPGVALDRQDPHDLIWIRGPFLSDVRDHGAVVVHGHTPVDMPEVKPNRINIDSGAVYGGPLTCLVVEGTEIRFLTA